MSYYLGGGGGYPQGNRAAPKSKDEDMEAAAALSALALGFAQPPSMQMPMQMPMPMPRSVPRPEEVPLRYLMGQQQRSPPMPPAPYYHRDSFDTWGQRRLDTPYQHLPASMEQALRGDQWEAPYEPYRYPPLWYQRERERQREWMASDMPPMSMQMPNRMMTVSRPPVYPPSRPPVSLPPPPQQHPQSVPPVARVAPSSARSSGGSEGMTRNESRNEKRRMQRAQMEKRKSSYRGVFWQGWGNGSGKWNVQISLGSKMKSIGFFTDEVEAARAYDRAAQQYLEDPVLNFLPNGEANPYRKLHRLAAKRLIDASGLNTLSASSSSHDDASLRHHLPPRVTLDPPSFKSMPARGGYGNDELTRLSSLATHSLAQSQFRPPASSAYGVPGWVPRDGRQGEGAHMGRGRMDDDADAEARGLLALRQARALVEVQAATGPMLRASSEQRPCVSNAATQRGMAEGPGRMSVSAFGPPSTGIAGVPQRAKKPASSKTRVIELSPPRPKGVQGRRRRGQEGEEADREEEGRQGIWPEEDAKIQARRAAKQESLDPDDVEVVFKEERGQPEARKGALSRGRGATTPSEEVGEAMDEDEEQEEGARGKGAEGGEGASAAQSGKVGKKRRFTALEPPWFFGRAHREAEERRKKADERRRAVEKAFAERAALEEAAAEKEAAAADKEAADKAPADTAASEKVAVEKAQTGDELSEAESVGSEGREKKGRKSDDKPKKRRSGLEPPWFLVPRPGHTDKEKEKGKEKETEGDSASEAEEKATRRGATKGEKSPTRAVPRRSGLDLPWFLAKREEKKASGVQNGEKGKKAAEAEDKAKRRSGLTGSEKARAGTKTEEDEDEEEEESGIPAGETKAPRAEAEASKADDGKGESGEGGKPAKKRSVMALDPPWFLAPGKGAEVVGRRREEPERRGKKDGRTPNSRAEEEPSRGRGKEATSVSDKSDKSDKEEAKTVKRRSLNAIEPPWPWFLSGGGGGESAEESRRKSGARRSAAEEPKATGKRKEQEGREARQARKATVQDEEEEEAEEEKAAQGKEEGKASEDQTAQKAKRRKRPELEEPWFFGAAKAEGEGRGRRERTPGQAAEEGAGKEEVRAGRGSRREGEAGKEEGHRDRRSKTPQPEEGNGRVVRRFAC